MILLKYECNYYPKSKVQLRILLLTVKVLIPTDPNEFQPREQGNMEKTHYFKSRRNQYFTINEMFMYNIWDEQTAFWPVKFILRNDFAD